MNHQHKEGEQCAICEFGIEEIERREKKHMEDYGWYAHIVQDDPDLPFGYNYHTHGFNYSWDHHDIQIILPIDSRLCHAIVNGIVNNLKKGKRYEVGPKYDDILDKYPVQFIHARECDRNVLRLILPDEDGELKGDYLKQLER